MFISRNTSRYAAPLAGILFALLPAPEARATSASALSTAIEAATALEVMYGLTVTRDSVAGGLLRPGQRELRSVFLVRGVTYVIVAGGCTDAHDVDMALFDAAGTLIIADPSEEPYAVGAITAPYTGEYIFLVSMAKSTPNGAHWVVVMGNDA